MANVVEIEVRGTDRTRSAFSSVTSSLAPLRARVVGLLKPLAGAAVNVATLASAAVTAAPALLKAGQAVWSVLQASLQASPALIALAAAGGFVMLTMKQIGPAIGKAFDPVTSAFKKAGKAAGDLAAKGIQPLAAEFARINMPTISDGMNRIATATNGALTSFMQWVNSAPGAAALRSIVDSTASAFERIAPKVSEFGIALASMIGRISGVSLAAGASGLSGVLDYLIEKMNGVNAASVQGGLDKLKSSFIAVKNFVTQAVDVISKAINIYRQYQTEFGLLADAIAILAIAFGGPITAAVAAIGLIIRHFDQLKAAWQGLQAFFTQTPMGTGFMDNLRAAAETVLPPLTVAFQMIREAVVPVLQEIWAKIQTQVIPAFGAFIAAIAPVVAFMVGVLGPVVAQVFNGILNVISGVIDIIVGVIKVFTGILTGDWTMAWNGVKQICSGAMQAIGGIIRAGIAVVVGIFRTIIGIIGGIMGAARNAAVSGFMSLVNGVRSVASTIGGAISSAVGNLGGLLVGAGRAVIQGLINGIRSMLGAVRSAASSVASAVRGALPFSPAKFGPLRDNPPDKAGQKIVEMLAAGMRQQLPRLTATVNQVIRPVAGGMRGGGAPSTFAPGMGRSSAPVVLEIRAGNSGIDEFLAEILRKYIRVQGGDVQLVLGR